MASRSLNRVQLIGNMTRDPELRYTPQGSAVCTFGLATNRAWVTEAGEKREEAEFHRIVAWNKLAELCAQLLFKGRRVYVDGRLQTRQWTAQDGSSRQTTEIVIFDMIILDSRREGETVGVGAGGQVVEPAAAAVEEVPVAEAQPIVEAQPVVETQEEPAAAITSTPISSTKPKKKKGEEKPAEAQGETQEEEAIKPGDIPF